MTPDSFDALSRLLRHRPGSQARELVRLVLVDGLTQADAAQRLGTSQQAASNALRAARATLALACRAARSKSTPQRSEAYDATVATA